MVADAFFYTFMALSLLYTIHMGLYIVGANIYDIWQYSRRARLAKIPRPHRRRPLVSVIIPAYNEQYNITRTLDSVRASSYKKIEIIVVDDGSSDQTSPVVREYIKALPGFKTSSYVKRYGKSAKLCRRFVRAEVDRIRMILVTQNNDGKASAVNNGVKNHAHGDLIMTLDADSMLQSDAIGNAVRYFENPRVVGVAANVRVAGSNTALSILQKIEHMIGYRSKKFYTMTNCEFIVGGVASTYRTEVLKEVGFYDTDTLTEDIGLSMKIVAQKGNRDWRIVYAADVVAGTEGVQTYKALFKQRYRWKLGMLQNLFRNIALTGNRDKKYSRMLTMYRIPMAFLGEVILMIEPVMLGYIIYLSVLHMTPQALLGAYATITLYVLWTLWPDEYLTLRDKIRFSFIAPFMYFTFYIMNAVQIVAVIRCIRNYKKVLGKVETVGRWISPERANASS
ncbi:MAG TPA: glycosyltransferase family 2 protein [Candidatus Limnocylindria bacterium]|nr:glycosyltransferase family 2 protein [Candidatus Limnocylindria bacterium]